MTVASDIGLYIPARNAAATLPAALAAVQQLDPAPAEIVVVVDPESRDDTDAIARDWGRARVIRQTRAGLTGARNEAISALHTPWVASLDADVVVAPDWLGCLAQARHTFPDAVAIGGRTEERILGVGDLWRALLHPHHWGAHPVDGPFMIVSEAIMQRTALAAIGGYREQLARYGDDSRLSADLRDAGFRLAYTPWARGVHIRHDDALGALDLRWNYAEPRMKTHLQDLSGVLAKQPLNRQYARVALTRARSAGAPELATVAAFLPIHHALSDLRAVLGERRLDDASKAAAVHDLGRALAEPLASWANLAALLTTCLARLVPAAAPTAPTWPRFAAWRTQVVDEVRQWLRELEHAHPELPDPNRALTPDRLADWNETFGGPRRASDAGARWDPPTAVTPWAAAPTLQRLPADPRALQVDLTAIAPGGSVAVLGDHPRCVSVCGTDTIRYYDSVPTGEIDVLVVPALDAFDSSRYVLSQLLPRCRTVILNYRPPPVLDAREVLMAGDIVEACAAAGLAIIDIETFVTDTRLRATRRAPAGAPHHNLPRIA